jgi:serine/threonine-protein kinase
MVRKPASFVVGVVPVPGEHAKIESGVARRARRAGSPFGRRRRTSEAFATACRTSSSAPASAPMLEIVEDTLEAGLVVAKRYRLEHPVGAGGMGVVWAARDLVTDRTYALKFLGPGRAADVRNHERLHREARATTTIGHPAIAKVHAVHETASGVPFIVMDLLVGESLRTVLARKGTLSVAECARILVPVLEAVEAAHAAGLVHRDLKPENVFLASGTEPKVLDFGIAKELRAAPATPLTEAGAVLGTPYYMAPEQVFAEADLDARADVWALGIMLYECLAGRRPTDASSLGQVLKRVTSSDLVPLATVRPDLPRALTSLVDRMLSRARAERPSLAEVRDALVAAAAEPPPAEPPPAEPEVDEDCPPTLRSLPRWLVTTRIVSAPRAPDRPPPSAWAPPR